jgi:ribosomal protein L11 methyltransferase
VREVALRVGADGVEEVLDALLLLAPHGVIEAPRGDEVVLRVRGALGELPPAAELAAAAGSWLRGVEERDVPDAWAERRLLDYEPLTIGGRLGIRPAWAPAPEPGILDIVLPETAFGTGAHVTTRACLELMLEPDKGARPHCRGAFADLGCGSGVLAIAAAKLGWSPVVALDVEERAVAATRANAEANGVAVEARTADLSREPPPAAPTVVANIPASVHVEIAPRLAELPRLLVATAIRIDNVEPVVEAYAARGLVERSRRVEATWVVLTLAPRSPSST